MKAAITSQMKRPAAQSAQEIRFWMSTPAVTVSMDARVSEALAIMHEHEIRRLPVLDDAGRLCGMITDGDIRGADVLRATGMDLREIASSLRRTCVYDVMTKYPITVMPNATLREAALLMLDNKIGGLPVVDSQNSVVGMITESDLFEALVCYIDRASLAA